MQCQGLSVKIFLKLFVVTVMNYAKFFSISFSETKFGAVSQQLARFLDYQSFLLLIAQTSASLIFEGLNTMQKKPPLHKYPLFFLLCAVSTENCSG